KYEKMVKQMETTLRACRMRETTGSNWNSEFADKMADVCYKKYESLPKKGKPATGKEWTLMACVVKIEGFKKNNSCNTSMEVVSLGTGSKCIGKSKMSSVGDILNDSHAEIMARRGFLRYLYHQIQRTYQSGSSEVFSNFSDGKCILNDDVTFHFFSSHTPCGDASIIPKVLINEDDIGISLKQVDKILKENSVLIIVVQKKVMLRREKLVKIDVHRTGAKCLPSESVQDEHLPGINYHVVGVLRTKPGRGDPTLSLSCSDKLARWNVVGCQGALLSLLIDKPIYFQSVIIGGGCPFSETVLQRAIIDRVSVNEEDIHLNLPKHYSIASPVIAQSTISFVHSRDSDDKKPCPSSLVWCNVPERMHVTQVAVEGKKQGATKKLAHTAAGRLLVCKRELLSQFIKVTLSMPQPMLNIPIILKSKQVIWDMNEDDIKRYLDHISYKQLKYLSQDYKKAWEMVRSVCFPSWLKSTAVSELISIIN
ncbi:hypothetical protein L9F63_024885, partial [Diploptera punctata]